MVVSWQLINSSRSVDLQIEAGMRGLRELWLSDSCTPLSHVLDEGQTMEEISF